MTATRYAVADNSNGPWHLHGADPDTALCGVRFPRGYITSPGEVTCPDCLEVLAPRPHPRLLPLVAVSARAVLAAIQAARDSFADPVAEYLEVLLIPAVYERWGELNRDRWPHLTLRREPGLSPKNLTDEQTAALRRARGWARYAGYTLAYGGTALVWNAVEDATYGHSPELCWGGIRRAVPVYTFLYGICRAVEALRQGHPQDSNPFQENLVQAGITIVNDLEEPNA